MPLTRFIDCVVDSNLYALVITGKPDESVLMEAWDSIKIEYADAMKDNESRMMTLLKKEIEILNINYQKILLAIHTLKSYYVKRFADYLNKALRSSYKLDVRFPDDYDRDLKSATNRSKGIFITLEMKRRGLEAMDKKVADGAKPATREHFHGILITLSDHVQYPIHDSITTWEFCDRVRRLNQDYERTNHKIKK